MRTTSLNYHELARDWQLAIAVGFVALTVFAAAVDHRNAIADRSAVNARFAERAVAPPTNREMVQEMMTHD